MKCLRDIQSGELISLNLMPYLTALCWSIGILATVVAAIAMVTKQ